MIAQLDTLYIRSRPWKLWCRLISYGLFEGRPLTTRGQWVNPLVFAHFAFEKRLPALRKVREPVFILGTGRSGTTVLGMVLSMHREVGFLNEPKALWHSIYPEEDLIGSYARGDARYRLGAEDATPTLIRDAHRLFGTYLAATLSRRVVDKYPELIFRVPFVRAIFPDAKFIFLMRNGWDTCRSIQGWSGRLGKSAGRDVHDWWGVNRRKWELLVDQIIPCHPDLAPYQKELSAFTNQVDMAAIEWIVTMREGLALISNDSGVIGVRFEDLSQRPYAVLRTLNNFLNLSEDKVFFNYGQSILHPVQDAGDFPLHPLVVKPFNETMRRLGYA